MLVVDTSAVLAALVGGSQAVEVADRLARDPDLHAPHLLDVEILQALRWLVRAKALSEDRAHDVRSDVGELAIVRYPHEPLGDRIWALRHNLTAYDAGIRRAGRGTRRAARHLRRGARGGARNDGKRGTAAGRFVADARGEATILELMAASTVRMTIFFELGDDGWTIASIPEIPGVHSQGRTREEARANVLDALEVMLTPDDDLPTGDREALVLTIEQ